MEAATVRHNRGEHTEPLALLHNVFSIPGVGRAQLGQAQVKIGLVSLVFKSEI